MLKTIERVTGRRIPVEKVPTVADLRARRLELTRAALEEILLEGDLEGYRVVVETLADEFDVMEVALAAVKLAHEAGGGIEDEEEIPQIELRPERDGDQRRGRERRGERPGERRRARSRGDGMTRLFIGAGRSAHIRPQDLVGAIAGETGLSGRDIGAIEIADRFSLVEVPEEAANEVITALRNTTIKGRKVNVRRERF
jgi:ATP-dependent RNA helicase DeaD